MEYKIASSEVNKVSLLTSYQVEGTISQPEGKLTCEIVFAFTLYYQSLRERKPHTMLVGM